jgi:TRAP-type C4-dicarboxylate transport system permease small subunit
MNHYFTKTFIKFLFAFLVILFVAFGVIVAAGVWNNKTSPVDNLAQPQ